MSEYQSDNILEQEIAELNREIEAKRAALEAQKGIVSERGAVHEVVAERLAESHPDAAALRRELQTSAASAAVSNSSTKAGYLANLSDEQIEEVNRLVGLIQDKGIGRAIAEAKTLDPFLLDAFHDALTDKLYEELVARGLVKK